MTNVAHDPNTDGRVVFDLQENDILLVHYIGDISLDFVLATSDRIVGHIENGVRRILYDVGDSRPQFTPVSLLDEVRRVGRAGGRRARFCYLAPENMFTRHFMLIEAAAFNDGIQVKFLSDEAEARAWLMDN
ncbi:hypothetical protein [Hyphobacterium sp.]|uniref:hypothetical protein n=1 Tax=Hyphobacterium sp. TaxID=2004662 RepID=UPI003748D312